MATTHDHSMKSAISPWTFPLEAVAKASEEALAATARANEAEERAKLTEDPGNARGIPGKWRGHQVDLGDFYAFC